MPQAMKIPDAKAAVDKELKKARNESSLAVGESQEQKGGYGCVHGVLEEWSDVLASRRSSHLTETGRMVGSQGLVQERQGRVRGEIDKHDVIKLHTEYHAPAPAASHAASAPVVEYIVPAVFYVTPAPVVEYTIPAASYFTPVLEVEYIAPATSYVTPASVFHHVAPMPALNDVPTPVGKYISPVPNGYATSASVGYIAHEPAVHAASRPFAEYIEPAPGGDVAPAHDAEYITRALVEFVEAALHEIDEVLCHDEIEELCYVVRMSQKRIWRRVWHSCSSPSDASKSERTWRALSARLCCEQGSTR